MDLHEGLHITPAIRLVRPLGQGGMGRVWLAEHTSLETQVVVKFMADAIAKDKEGSARFAREASVAASVKSPHVVQVLDHGVTADGTRYIVMELLEGHDLAEHIKTHGRMTPQDVAALVAQVAKGLGKAHQVGVIHRDIKPDNIFLCDAGADGEMFVKLLDFGIAKHEHRVTDAATSTGAVVGTPFYMSPEQIVGTTLDARTDIWSLGVVAFEALTGKRPFEGSTVGAITLAIHTKKPKITDHVPSLPATLDAWFAKACAQEPAARFATAREASLALLTAIGETPGPARLAMPSLVGLESQPLLEPPHERAETHLSSTFAAEPSKPKPPFALVAGVAVVVLLLGGAAVFALARSSGSAPSPPVNAATSQAPPAVSFLSPPVPSASIAASATVEPPVEHAPPASPSVATATPAAQPVVKPAAKRPPAKTTKRRDDDDIK